MMVGMQIPLDFLVIFCFNLEFAQSGIKPIFAQVLNFLLAPCYSVKCIDYIMYFGKEGHLSTVCYVGAI